MGNISFCENEDIYLNIPKPNDFCEGGFEDGDYIREAYLCVYDSEQDFDNFTTRVRISGATLGAIPKINIRYNNLFVFLEKFGIDLYFRVFYIIDNKSVGGRTLYSHRTSLGIQYFSKAPSIDTSSDSYVEKIDERCGGDGSYKIKRVSGSSEVKQFTLYKEKDNNPCTGENPDIDCGLSPVKKPYTSNPNLLSIFPVIFDDLDYGKYILKINDNNPDISGGELVGCGFNLYRFEIKKAPEFQISVSPKNYISSDNETFNIKRHGQKELIKINIIKQGNGPIYSYQISDVYYPNNTNQLAAGTYSFLAKDRYLCESNQETHTLKQPDKFTVILEKHKKRNLFW